MNFNKYVKWVSENVDNRSNFYVLVGPAAVGKSTWVKNNLETSGKEFVVIDRDRIIVQLYKDAKAKRELALSNKHLYTSPETDEPHPVYGKVIKYSLPTSPDKERRAYELIYKTNEKINKQYDDEIKDAITKGKDIVIDGLNSDKIERYKSLKHVIGNKNYKIIGVFFPFSGYEEKIKVDAIARAKDLAQQLGPDFDRNISDAAYDKMFAKISKPTEAEGFDEIIYAGRFKDKDMEKNITQEEITISFKNWLNEDILNESSVSELITKHNIPKTLAKHAKTKCSNGNVDFILKIFLKNYKNMVESMTSDAANDKEKMLSDNYIIEFDRFMSSTGKTLDSYLKNYKGKKYRKELLELCEQGWPKFLKKMREYKKSIGSLNEVRLNKTWKNRIKARARRHDRDISDEDKKWAKDRIKSLNKNNPELEEAYLNEIEKAMEATKASKDYLQKLRDFRKKRQEQKMVKPTPANIEQGKKSVKPSKYDPNKPVNKIKGGATHSGDIKPFTTPSVMEEIEENANEDN